MIALAHVTAQAHSHPGGWIVVAFSLGILAGFGIVELVDWLAARAGEREAKRRILVEYRAETARYLAGLEAAARAVRPRRSW